jgi:hypothetical protein
MKLYHGTSVRFKKFNLAFTCDMGFHFADDAIQARQRLANTTESGDPWIILACEIDLCNPIQGMDDVGDWSDHQNVALAILNTQENETLMKIAQRYLNEPYSFIGLMPHERMRADLLEAGYDGIIYNNVAEGYGKSYLVFRPSQVQIVED